MNDYRLLSWLAQQEDIHRMVLYQCDKHMTNWSQRCIRQADAILIVCLAGGPPEVGKVNVKTCLSSAICYHICCVLD